MNIQTPGDLFLRGLESTYDAEQQLSEILAKMAEASCSPQLRSTFEHHLAETREHVVRAQEIFKQIHRPPESRSNRILQQIEAEISELIESIAPSPMRDAALIVAASQVEHFEIASYTSLLALATLLGMDEAGGLIQKTLDEEKKADAKLTTLGDEQIYLQAMHRSAAAAANC
jgi:ferritin-like metal-binding protein YciE